jgi:hypothetical protein
MRSPVVWQMWAWCRSRSTVAVAVPRVLGHEFVETGRVQVGRDRHGTFLVGGVDEAVETFGGVLGHREQADVVDNDELGAEHAGDGLADGVIRAVAADEDADCSRVNQATFVPARPRPGRRPRAVRSWRCLRVRR